MSVENLKIVCVVDFFLPDTFWLFESILFSCEYCSIWSVVGLKSLDKFIELVFGIGITLPSFQLSGNLALYRELLTLHRSIFGNFVKKKFRFCLSLPNKKTHKKTNLSTLVIWLFWTFYRRHQA